MNPDKNKDQVSNLLKEAGATLKRVGSQPSAVPPAILQVLRAAREKKFPVVKELSQKEMEALLLKVLSEKPMDGFEIATSLEKAHIKLKQAGEGVIYGLLSNLESSSYLQTEWREQGERMIKIYRLTDKGGGLLRKSESHVAQLNAWSESVLAAGTSTT